MIEIRILFKTFFIIIKSLAQTLAKDLDHTADRVERIKYNHEQPTCNWDPGQLFWLKVGTAEATSIDDLICHFQKFSSFRPRHIMPLPDILLDPGWLLASWWTTTADFVTHNLLVHFKSLKLETLLAIWLFVNFEVTILTSGSLDEIAPSRLFTGWGAIKW